MSKLENEKNSLNIEAHCMNESTRVDFTHTESDYHLLMPISGSIRVLIDDQMLRLASYRSILIQPQQHYQVRMENHSSLCLLRIHQDDIQIKNQFQIIETSNLLKEVIIQICSQKKLNIHSNHDKYLFQLLKELIQVKGENQIQVPIPKDKRAKKIFNLMSEANGLERSFEELISEVGTSRRTLERAFLNDTGLTFSKWRQLLRLQKSLELLDQGSTVAETSGAIGYSSSSAFIHAFKEHFGISPGQYLIIKK